MGTAARGQGGPARAPSTLTQLDRELLELDRELLELERRKLVERSRGAITLTREGYRELARLGLARNGSGRRS